MQLLRKFVIDWQELDLKKKEKKKIGKHCKREDCIERDSQNNDLRSSTLWKCQKNGKICFTAAFIENRGEGL